MVSVCMATYNGAKFVKVQIDSILCQIAPDDELIISDDGSTDGTLDIIRSYNDNRIRLFNNEGRHGFTANFYNAFIKARGEYIFVSDQDDIWTSDKYAKVMSYLQDYFLVHHDSIIVDEDNNIIIDSFYGYYHNGSGILKNMYKSTFYGSHMAFSKSFLQECLPFPDTKEIGYDLWIGLVAIMNAKNPQFVQNGKGIIFITDKLIRYRRHDNAFCGMLKGSKRPLYRKLLGRLLMAKYVMKYRIKQLRKIRNS